MLRPLGLSLISFLSSAALAQEAGMPDMPGDCVAIAAQIQVETHVRFMPSRTSLSSMILVYPLLGPQKRNDGVLSSLGVKCDVC